MSNVNLDELCSQIEEIIQRELIVLKSREALNPIELKNAEILNKMLTVAIDRRSTKKTKDWTTDLASEDLEAQFE